VSQFSLPLGSTFVQLLTGAAVRKPDDAVFMPGYEAAIADVATPGTAEFFGLQLSAGAGVYTPGPNSTTEFIAKNWWAAHLDKGAGRRLLELGCGSGALSLYAARQGWTVTGGDIERTAVECACANALDNHIAVRFVQSDLFAAFAGDLFDVVVFNLPYMHKDVVTPAERAIADARGGLARRFLDDAHQYLTPGGRLIFTYSNCSNASLLDRADWHFDLVACDYESRGKYWRTLISATSRPAP
jgi:methylase of polypeptide subunit release factors